jgi:hypothetical protein
MARGQPKAEVVLGADAKQLEKDLEKARGKWRDFGKGVKNDLAQVLRGGLSGLGSIGGFSDVFNFSQQAQGVYDFEKRLVRLRIASGLSAGELAKMRDAVLDIGASTGVDPAQLIGGVEQYVALTGNVQGAREQMELFAKVAQATGAQMGDVTTSAAAMSQQLGITTAGDMEQAFSILIAQGKAGSVELKDMAQIASSIAPQFAQFGTTGTRGLAEMGAHLQIVRRGFGSTSEASTGYASLLGSLMKKQSTLKKAGLQLDFVGPDGARHLRSVTDIMTDLDVVAENVARKKGISKEAALSSLLGDKESIRAAIQLMKAGRDEVDALASSTASAGDVAKDYATYSQSAAAAQERAAASAKKVWNEVLARHLGTIASAFEKIAKIMEWMADNPLPSLLGLGAVKWGPGLAGALMASRGVGGAGAAVGGGAMGQAGLYAGAAIAAGSLGYALGTLIDDATGLSDALAGVEERAQDTMPDKRSEIDSTGKYGALAKRLAGGMFDDDPKKKAEVQAALGVHDTMLASLNRHRDLMPGVVADARNAAPTTPEQLARRAASRPGNSLRRLVGGVDAFFSGGQGKKEMEPDAGSTLIGDKLVGNKQLGIDANSSSLDRAMARNRYIQGNGEDTGKEIREMLEVLKRIERKDINSRSGGGL